MDQKTLFAAAIGLTQPWEIQNLQFDADAERLDITIGFPPGSHFTCPVCGSSNAKAHDTKLTKWRHLNFFQHEAWLHAKVPRVKCDKGCAVRRVDVPWARPGSGFTLLFEALIMLMVRETPVARVAKLLDVHDTKLWRVVHHYVKEAREEVDMAEVQGIGMDETASRRGHNYISCFFDMDRKRLLFATEGKNKATVESFANDLKAHNGNPKSVLQVCCDMSPAFISGVKEHFSEAEITFDRFHIMKLVNEAVDQVRRQEVKDQPQLKNTRYIWLKNKANLTEKQKATMIRLSHQNLKTGRAYRIRLSLQELFQCTDREEAEAFLKRWYFWATHSRLPPIIAAAKTIKRHWDGVLNWFQSRLTTGLIEGFNSLLQAAKARARGYRSNKNFIAMAYLIGGKLNFKLPT